MRASIALVACDSKNSEDGKTWDVFCAFLPTGKKMASCERFRMRIQS